TGALDVRAALHASLGAGVGLDGPLQIDTALLADDDAAFAWRRLAGEAGVALEPVDLGAPLAALDFAVLDGFAALVRWCARDDQGDLRRALLTPSSGVPLAEARTLLTTAGERGRILDVIARGSSAAAQRFAHAASQVAAAYRAPDASGTSVLRAALLAFPIAHEPTRAALERVAADFDAARAFAEAWEAEDLLGEVAAELSAAPPRTAELAREPAAPVHDEPSVPVAARRRSFSASALNAYAECARKWWFRYVCAAVEDRGSSASFYGIAFHAALEEFHGKYARFETGDAAALLTYLDACIVGAFDRTRSRFDADVEFELQRRRARRTAKKYVAWLVQRAERAPFEVTGCEAETDVELGTHRFIGYIDRLDRDLRTGTVTVVDYKTGSIATTAQEYLADVRAFREFQLPFYYWARTAAGDTVTRLALIPLKDALLDVAPVELEVVSVARPALPRSLAAEISTSELERARERMIALADELSAGERTHFPATDDPDACRYCAYAPACRERPLVLEERFGR
ncbi:MAG: PD-(D/E)XK nuclease family protein, partial [Candidatus Eremiobacteraeota bacterium]|nr:PD-(D/E)XK nuclease family protein [Candidatus Eremiobacteraeota bacterium]